MLNEQRFYEVLNNLETVEPILVMGDIGIDKYTYGEVTRISPEAPVPVLEVKKEWLKLGLAANVLDNLQSLSVRGTLCSVIGDDLNGKLLLGLMKEEGLNPDKIMCVAKRKTTFKERVLTQAQQICRVDYESLGELTDEEADKILSSSEELVANHSCFIIEDYGKGLMTKEVCSTLIKKFRAQGKLVAVDPSRRTHPLYYYGATLLKPNRDEALIMAHTLGYEDKSKDLANIEKVAHFLVEKLGLEKIIITLGADGMGFIDTAAKSAPEFQVIPTLAQEVFDVSGAGDTAIATVVAALMAGASLTEAAWVGNCASGIVVGKRGTATCTQEELKKFYRDHFRQ